MAYEFEKKLLPEFPRTAHLPFEPNASGDDMVEGEGALLALGMGITYGEEKLDGASVGITIHSGQPVIRNRTHILNKAYAAKDTPAKKQFASIWTWFYDNQDRFRALEKTLGWMPSVYGEWLYAQHTVAYDKLPDLLIAYDIYNPATGKFLDTLAAREALGAAGFSMPVLLGTIQPYAPQEMLPSILRGLRDGMSYCSTSSLREGVYLKVCANGEVVARYKMVAPWFKSDDNWAKQKLTKNKLAKKGK